MKTIHIVGDTLPFCWEEAVIRTWQEGSDFPTEYDQRERGDPPSKDVCALIHVKEPMKEPRIHRALPNGLDFLEEYRSELLYGCHDYYMDDLENPDRWKYTYSGRMSKYDVPCNCVKKTNTHYNICPDCSGSGTIQINQIDECIKKLKKTGYSRRIQAVLWKPWQDLYIDDPPCVNVVNFRVENSKLNMSILIRSNDGFKAAFDNLFGFSELQKHIADQVGIEVGSLVWTALSFHIYGSYFNEFEGFLKTVENRTFEERTYTTDFALPFFIEACDKLLAEPKMPEDKEQLILKRKKYLQSEL